MVRYYGLNSNAHRGKIRHLELTFEAERPPPLHHVQQELLRTAEELGEYF